jgi:outer membrane protein TolC
VVGLSTSLDVLDANDKLFQAEVALAAEKARKAQARVELERALGTL